MIYLIQTDYFDYENPGKPLSLLKIGSTEEKNYKGRMKCYKVCNPRHKLLCVVGGTAVEERRLHAKFSLHKYPDYGDEWFYYSDEIVEFVKAGVFDNLEITAAEQTRADQNRFISEISNSYGIDFKGIDYEALGSSKTKSAVLKKLMKMFPEKFNKAGELFE